MRLTLKERGNGLGDLPTSLQQFKKKIRNILVLKINVDHFKAMVYGDLHDCKSVFSHGGIRYNIAFNIPSNNGSYIWYFAE